ncbi:MAG: hypothetical protein JST26_05200 [Bacteroidetes bacterium]|nr:hypothetical protein [Bacteroidota bacterium]
MEHLEHKKILAKIIRKGGLMADCARFYAKDDELAKQFIIECSRQCHNKLLKKEWGKGLIFEIKSYYRKHLPL